MVVHSLNFFFSQSLIDLKGLLSSSLGGARTQCQNVPGRRQPQSNAQTLLPCPANESGPEGFRHLHPIIGAALVRH